MTAKASDLDKPELWTCAQAECKLCGTEWVAVITTDTPLNILECYRCGAQDSKGEYI